MDKTDSMAPGGLAEEGEDSAAGLGAAELCAVVAEDKKERKVLSRVAVDNWAQ